LDYDKYMKNILKKTYEAFRRLLTVLGRLGRKKDWSREPTIELDLLSKQKTEMRKKIASISETIDALSARIAEAHEGERLSVGQAREFAHKEGSAESGNHRREYERKRWQSQERRRSYEREKWSLAEPLRQHFVALHSLHLNLLSLDARESEIERMLQRERELSSTLTAKPMPTEQAEQADTAPELSIVRKHILARDLVLLAVRTFRVKPGMTMLTVLGIGVSFATIFFLVSFGYGMEKVLLDQFASDTLMRSLTVQSPNPDAIPLDHTASDLIRALPGIEHVEPVFGLSGQVESDSLAAEVELRGADPTYFSVSGGILKDGRVYENGEHAIVLSSSFLQTMDKKSLADFAKPFSVTVYRPHTREEGEGVEVLYLGDDFRVVGIVDDDENPNVFLPPGFISDLVPQYNALNILAMDEASVPGLRSSIADLGFMTSSVADTVDQATKVFNVAEVILALFGAASLIVATIGMVNTMTVSLLERTQEIGIMKVLGVSDGDVRRLFLLEASIIGGLGGLSGLVMGITLSQGFNMLINVLAHNLGGKSVSLFYYPSWFILSIVISALIIGFLTGLIPSQRAAKMDPLNAVKYK